jgi:hypothetical protein
MGRTGSRGRRFAVAATFVGLVGVLQLAPTGADTVSAPATITRQAYFTNPITQATPPVLRNGFPPGTVCLVAGLAGLPQLCGPEVQQLGGALGLSDGLPIPVTPDGDLAQLVALPGTTPVGMLAGQQRYATLLQLALPALPAGERFGSFELVLHQSGVNFAIESPAVRDIVLQIVAQLEDQDPQKVADAVTRALSGEVPLATDTITGIEACPATQAWKEGGGQGAALDGSRLPDVQCLIGTTGNYDKAAGTYTFDLTYAAQAWTEGIEGAAFGNEGIILRPVGAPNLAYGDPDLSTNWVVSLADASAAEGLRPEIRYTTVAAPTSDDGGGLDLGVGLPSFDSSGPIDFGSPSAPGGGASLGGALRARFAERDEFDGRASTPGWVWLALPIGVAGAVVFAQSLAASPVATRRRPGALSRLMAERDLDAPA